MKLRILTLGLITIVAASCVKDRSTTINSNPAPPVNTSGDSLIYYWNFNNPDTTQILIPTSSILTGSSLAYAGKYYDTVQPGTLINGQGGDSITTAGGAALRLRNPSGTFTLTLPTTGYKNIVLKYAVQTSSTKHGSTTNTISYTTDGNTWPSIAVATINPVMVDTNWSLVSIDFSSDTLVNNNSHFKVKIDFAASTSGATDTTGNDRFDNITLWGAKQ